MAQKGRSYKRVYEEKVLDWAKGFGATGTIIIGLIFSFLLASSCITITSHSGDSVCAGTLEDPCYAYVSFIPKKDIYIYPLNESLSEGEDFKVLFDPNVKDWKLQRTWGKSWRTINLYKPWSKRVKYAVKFTEGKEYSIRIVGYKYDPNDKIKWTLGIDGNFINDLLSRENIDPYWLPVKEEPEYKLEKHICEPHIVKSGNSETHKFNVKCVDHYYSGKEPEFELTDDLKIIPNDDVELETIDYRFKESIITGEVLIPNEFGKLELVNQTESVQVQRVIEFEKGKEYDLDISQPGKYQIGSGTDVFEVTDFYYAQYNYNVSIDTNVTLTNLHTDQNESHMVGYWKFTDDATDSSPQGNDGTVSGATHIHEHYEFDGDNDGITVSGTETIIDDGDSFTLSTWVKFNQIKDYNCIAGKYNDCLGNWDTDVDWALQASSSTITLALTNDTGAGVSRILVSGPVADKWYHLAMTWNTTDVAGYVDGASATTYTIDLGGDLGTEYPFRMGYSSTAGRLLNGTIDEVIIYNRSLSATDIADLYADGLYHTVDKGSAYIDGGVLDLTEYNRIRDIAFTCVNDSYSNCSLSYRTGNYSKVDLTDTGLVSYWNLSEAESSTDFLDSVDPSSTGNNGTCSGNSCPNRTSGVFESDAGMLFDGVDDEISISSFSGLPSQNITVCVWAYIKSYPHTWMRFVNHKWSDAGSWLLFLRNNNQVYFGVNGTTSSAMGTVSLNKWHHVCGTYNSTSTGIYLDGVLGDTDSTSKAITLDTAGSVEISQSTAEINGTIDSVAIYNRSLSADEIQDLYTEWGGWSTKTTQSPTTINTDNRTLQYRVYLESDNTTSNPYLTNVTLFYNNSAPVVSPYIITDAMARNDTRCNLTGTFSVSDYDSDATIANETKWYNNSIEMTSLRNHTVIMYGNTSVENNWTFSARTHDSYEWGSWVNSSILKIEWDPLYSMAYPSGISFFEVNASEHTNFSLVPIGQNSTQGIFQVTCGGGDARGFDLYIRSNESLNSCMWITVDDDNTESGGFNLTTTYQEILTNLGITANTSNIWAWVSFNNCTEGVDFPGFDYEARAE